MAKFAFLTFIFVFSFRSMALPVENFLKQDSSAKSLIRNKANISFCEMDPSGKIQGNNVDQLIRWASVSKLFTTYWALSKYSPFYRFKTQLYLTNLNDGSFDLHIKGGSDLFFNKAMGYFLVSELNRIGVKKIRNVSFDENFRLPLHLKEKDYAHSYIGSEQGPISLASTQVNLKELLNVHKWNPYKHRGYRETLKMADSIGVKMLPQVSLIAGEVSYKEKSAFAPQGTEQVYTLYSAPIIRILKDMNVYSNNYIADMWWYILGGADEFKKFAFEELNLTENDVVFLTGSGLNVRNFKNRIDNKASCRTVLKIIESMDHFLKSSRLSNFDKAVLKKDRLDLTDVMLVGGVDVDSAERTTNGSMVPATLNAYSNEQYSKAVVAKTGTLDFVKSLAGQVSTQSGPVYFAVSVETKPYLLSVAVQMRDSFVRELLRNNGGKKNLEIDKIVLSPFDRGSYLRISDSIDLGSKK